MPEFKKGQLVAVKIPGATKWELRVFERVALTDEPFCVEVIVRRPEDAIGYCVCIESVCPAEKIWPDIFLACDRETIESRNQAIGWLCERLEEATRNHRFCPPNVWPGDCDNACWECWQQAVYEAMENTKDE